MKMKEYLESEEWYHRETPKLLEKKIKYLMSRGLSVLDAVLVVQGIVDAIKNEYGE